MWSGLWIFVYMVHLHFQQNCMAQDKCPDDGSAPGLRMLNATSIQFFFSKYTTNGKIGYLRRNSLGCLDQKNIANTKETKTVTQSTIINDLLPYSLYDATISYRKNGADCLKSTIFNTTTLDALGNEEKPIISHKYNATDVTVSIRWPCEHLGGPILYKIDVTCISRDCNQEHTPYVKNETEFAIDINFKLNTSTTKNLVTFNYWRGKDSRVEKYEVFLNFQEPGKVQDIKAYNINETSISLKWLPPPNSNVELYEVSYYHDVEDEKVIKVDGQSKCQIWRDYICHTINGDFLKQPYNFEIKAKNHYVKKFGTTKFYGASSDRERVPSPPININYVWNDDRTSTITWQHPDVPNGKILEFYIGLNNEFSLSFKVTKESLNYTYKINVNDYKIKSKKLLVEMVALNEIGNSTKGLSWYKKLHFSEPPEIENITNSKFDIRIPTVLDVEGDVSKMYVVITDTESPRQNAKLHPRELNLFNEIEVEKEYSWTIGEYDLTNITTVTVGDNTRNVSRLDSSWMFNNNILKIDHLYDVTIVLRDTLFKTTKIETYTLSCNTSAVVNTASGYSNNGFGFIFSLFLIPVVFNKF